MKLVEANYIFMTSKRRHLEFMVSSILHKDARILRNLITRIKNNREIYRRGGCEYVALNEIVEGVELNISVIYENNQSSEEPLFRIRITSKPLYPPRRWDNCTGNSVLEHIQEYLNNVIIRKKIII